MKVKPVKKYKAGYNKSELIKKCTAVAVSAVICGGLASCNTIQGEVSAYNQYDGGMETISSDCSSDADLELMGEEAYSSADEGEFELDGDVAYISSADEKK